MNDLFEKRKSWQLIHGMIPATIVNSTSEAINEFSKTFSNILAQYKQISLTLDYKNIGGWESPMMWGQYAHNEKGVCIEFDSEKLHFPKNAYRAKIKYSYDVPAIVFAKEDVLIDGTYLEQFIIENRKAIFFTKHKHWEHENEYRIVSNRQEWFPIAGAINRVYVCDHRDVNTRVVEELIRGEVPINYMDFSHQQGCRSLIWRNIEGTREILKNKSVNPYYYSDEDRLGECLKEYNDIFDLSRLNSAKKQRNE